VTWTAPFDGGSAIQEYTVRSTPGDFVESTDGSARSVSFSGLTNGTAYTFTVVATNAVGNSAPGTSSPVTPVAVPGAPTSVSAVPGNGTAAVSWTAPSDDGGAVITGYTVTSAPGGITAETAEATSVTVSGLANGTAYTFTVVATNSVGNSATGASSAVTPVVSVAPTTTTPVNPTPPSSPIPTAAPIGLCTPFDVPTSEDSWLSGLFTGGPRSSSAEANTPDSNWLVGLLADVLKWGSATASTPEGNWLWPILRPGAEGPAVAPDISGSEYTVG